MHDIEHTKSLFLFTCQYAWRSKLYRPSTDSVIELDRWKCQVGNFVEGSRCGFSMKALIPFIYAEKEKQNLQTRYPVSEQRIEFVAPCVDGRSITLWAVAHERPGRYVTVAVHSMPVGLRNNWHGNWPRHGTEARSMLSLFQTQMMSSIIPTGLSARQLRHSRFDIAHSAWYD
jgi:hypothetical protein